MGFLNQVYDWFLVHGSAVATVFGVLFTLSKAVSTEKAVPVVSKVQAIFDVTAKALIKLGEMMGKVAEFLASVLASDGLLGKK